MKDRFFGFKLHIIIDDKGNLMNAKLTKGKADDRSISASNNSKYEGLFVRCQRVIGKDLFLCLMSRGLKIIKKAKHNMRNISMSFEEKILLRKSLVETVFDYLKNKFMLEQFGHRSFINMLVHIISTLTAYQLKSTKPSVSGLLIPFPKP